MTTVLGSTGLGAPSRYLVLPLTFFRASPLQIRQYLPYRLRSLCSKRAILNPSK
jgi:hypothetical protein